MIYSLSLDFAPPRGGRFGGPGSQPRALGAARAGRRGEACTEDNLLRQVVYEGLREDKPAREVRREIPNVRG